MKEKYKVKIYMGNLQKLNTLGIYGKEFLEKREYFEFIKLDKKKILYISEIKNMSTETVLYFLLFHEIGHFLLEKAKYIQKEEYADYLSVYLMRNMIDKEKLEIKKIKVLLEVNMFKIKKEIEDELKDIADLFIHLYQKYYR
ncbi:MAG: hypothetical protein ACRC5T_00950 [Cetobacterium sp.]